MDEQAIYAKLDRASALMFAKDMAIVDELWSNGFRLVGSEVGEIAETRDELEGLVAYVFTAPFRLRWIWDSKPVTIENDIAWVFAQGRVEFVYDRHVHPAAYRLAAIFRRAGTDWTWRLYSGSEPMPQRAWPSQTT
ncbi:nuclear transport factor 2 family protein [Rhizobium sp. LjRoot254]|uniref:nuclear transport factor 2 family protein n=1 Tax=Rhizobium sp. LjRoot254 TaxID=3342297 RepID=UPI003ECF1B3B